MFAGPMAAISQSAIVGAASCQLASTIGKTPRWFRSRIRFFYCFTFATDRFPPMKHRTRNYISVLQSRAGQAPRKNPSIHHAWFLAFTEVYLAITMDGFLDAESQIRANSRSGIGEIGARKNSVLYSAPPE